MPVELKACKVEHTTNPDGTPHVRVHVPVLDLVKKVGVQQAREITGLPIPDSISQS